MDVRNKRTLNIKLMILIVIVKNFLQKLNNNQCLAVFRHTQIHMDQGQLVIKYYLNLKLGLINSKQHLKEQY